MSWLSGPCVTPGDGPSAKVRQVLADQRREHEERIARWEEAERVDEARWPGHEVGER